MKIGNRGNSHLSVTLVEISGPPELAGLLVFTRYLYAGQRALCNQPPEWYAVNKDVG